MHDKITDATHEDRLTQAREANNTFQFEGREMELFVARGEAQVATNIFRNGKETGAQLVHRFKWIDADPFVKRENSFWTNLQRVGRRQEQKIQTAHQVTVNAELYSSIVQSGILIEGIVNGEPQERQLSREQMLEHARLYPEAVSEAIEAWLDAGKIERYDNSELSFDFLFKAEDVIKMLWYMGPRDNPVVAVVFSFKAPSSEERKRYDEAVQSMETKRQGELSTTTIEENFTKKVQYGGRLLMGIEGSAYETEGNLPNLNDPKQRETFITLFNPIWFGDVVEEMHASFDFMKGRSDAS